MVSKSTRCSQLVLSISCGSRFVRSQLLVLSAMSVDGSTTMDPKPLELKVQNTLFCKSHLSWCLITDLEKSVTYRDSSDSELCFTLCIKLHYIIFIFISIQHRYAINPLMCMF